MLTRCPRCETTFRVTPDQLKARHGRVRCGNCQNVFDALETLIDAPPPQAQVAVEPAATPAAPASTSFVSTAAAEPDAPAEFVSTAAAEPDTLAEPTAEESDTAQDGPGAATAPEITVTPPEAPELIEAPLAPEEVSVVAAETAPVAENAEAESAEESVEEEAGQPLEPLLHEESPKRIWPWLLGSLFALILLSLQAAIHYRTEIAILSPGMKPLLLALCVPIGCDVPLPRKAELIGIETSNLSPDPGGKLALSATLKNRAPFAQQFPDLELTLSDTSEKPLVRRVLAPADYLAPEALAAGFGADSEVAVNLAVDAPGIPAAGYQLYLFYR